MEFYFIFAVTLLVLSGHTDAQTTFRYANYYGDNMVLQRAPAAAIVWGYVPNCKPVNIMFNEKTIPATIIQGNSNCRFSAQLPPTSAGGPYTISASTDQGGAITLKNVLFGDVWVCGGQSNMVFTLPQAYNATEEMAKAANYPNIRLFTVQRVSSATELEEPPEILQQWSVASTTTVNGGAWQYFSAVCWFYGRDIYDQYKIPLGLISSNWGGTPDEAWSSPDALKMCSSVKRTSIRKHDAGPDPHQPSVLWNSMMYPLLNMTIYGAIWYQGEANANDPEKYNCTFPAMISDWRQKWHEATSGQTNGMFPFGFVQLSAVGSNNQSEDGFAGIRWAQTASYGYVPNPALQNVFMAVSMDLGDPSSPYGSVHPRDKEDVGARLALAGRAIAYNDNTVYYSGPLVQGATIAPPPPGSKTNYIIVTFRNIPAGDKIELRSPYGFELGCTTGSHTTFLPGTVVQVEGATSIDIDFPLCPEGSKMTSVRYAWMEDPCPFMKCAVYSGGLPSPPFIISLG